MQADPWLVQTGQRWKIVVGLLAAPSLWLAIVVATLQGYLGASDAQWLSFFLGGLTFFVLGFVWAVASVRCPACGARLLWLAMREQRAENWWVWLHTLQACPVCRSGGLADRETSGDRREASRPGSGFSSGTPRESLSGL